MALAAATFASILLLLNAALGSVGQFLGLILMLVQLVTAGGTFPWQTLPAPLAAIHHALPMAYAVDGLRQAMFGGDAALAWGDAGVLAIWLVAAVALATGGGGTDDPPPHAARPAAEPASAADGQAALVAAGRQLLERGDGARRALHPLELRPGARGQHEGRAAIARSDQRCGRGAAHPLGEDLHTATEPNTTPRAPAPTAPPARPAPLAACLAESASSRRASSISRRSRLDTSLVPWFTSPESFIRALEERSTSVMSPSSFLEV